jgi:ubiquinone/menaquinone biosynthesis C-methylase UbiE
MEHPPRRQPSPARADRPQYKRPTPNKPHAGGPSFQKPHANRPKPGKPQGTPSRKPAAAGGVTDWNGVANWYDDLVGDNGSEFHREVVIPGTLRLLAAARGDPVLDVACGQGVLCRALAANGIEATGIDAAVELIRAARDRQEQASANDAPVTYQVGDARDLSFVPAGRFAAAACVLAVQNIHPLGGLLSGIARALRPGGRLVLVMMHPCFRPPKASGWGWDERAGVQFRRVDHYLLPRKVPIVTHPGSAPDQYTWSFHKPIGAYVRALRNAGLLVDAMEEWPSHKKSTSGPRAAAENVAREEIPMFMAIRAVKVGEPPAAVGEE